MKKWVLPALIALLAAFSLASLKSIAPHLLAKQALFFALGSIAFSLLASTTYSDWRLASALIYWGLNLVLLGLLIFGQATRGTTGWIQLWADFKFQPSQFAIFASALFISFRLPQLDCQQLSDLLILLAWVLLPGILILLQPDIGMFLVYLGSLAVVFLLAHISFKYWLGLVALGALSLIAAWVLLLNPQRKQRITSFISGYQAEQAGTGLSTQQAETASSYNARQALIAVGSGQLFGRGLGFGIQSHLKFLPERQTDFIFASIAEEWGFVGASLLIAFYLGLSVWLWLIAGLSYLSGSKRAKQQARPAPHQSSTLGQSPAQVFVLVQLTMFLWQIMINIGMNLGLMPITGITLPLVSYGGSSVLALMSGLGLVQSVVGQVGEVEWREIS
jgi:rod shape determining protein RodA